jgi:hypothetical protein
LSQDGKEGMTEGRRKLTVVMNVSTLLMGDGFPAVHLRQNLSNATLTKSISYHFPGKWCLQRLERVEVPIPIMSTHSFALAKS